MADGASGDAVTDGASGDAVTDKPPRNRHAYERDLMREARESFASHELKSVGACGMRWVLMRREGDKWNSNLWCEIVVLRAAILVYGDVDTCLFAGYSGGGPRETVAWIGAHGDIDYPRGKAARGMDSREVTRRCVPEVLHAELLAYLADYENSNDESMEDEKAEALDDAIERASDASSSDECDAIVRELYEADVIDGETASGMGEATTRRVIVAHAAIARLHTLLSATPAVNPPAPTP